MAGTQSYDYSLTEHHVEPFQYADPDMAFLEEDADSYGDQAAYHTIHIWNSEVEGLRLPQVQNRGYPRVLHMEHQGEGGEH